MKTVKLFVILTILALFSAVAVPAQEKVPEKLGKVVFLTSCDAKVQPRFERAVALLHSFSWQEGEKAFRGVLEDDPNNRHVGYCVHINRKHFRCRADAGRSAKS
jgi:hypothetical protein